MVIKRVVKYGKNCRTTTTIGSKGVKSTTSTSFKYGNTRVTTSVGSGGVKTTTTRTINYGGGISSISRTVRKQGAKKY